MPVARVLLPVPPRHLAHARALNVTSRTVHLAAISVLVGGHVFAAPTVQLEPWLWAAIVSGAALIAIEVYPSFDWLAQGSGLFVLAKLALLAVVPFAWSWRVPILFAVVALAGIGSHMPGRYRHYSLIYRRNMKRRSTEL
jgi:hypothetical protein